MEDTQATAGDTIAISGGGGGGQDSIRRYAGSSTPGSASILASTPSTDGGIKQCMADGSALREQQTLARRFGSISGGGDELGRGIGSDGDNDDDKASLSLSDMEEDERAAPEKRGGDKADGRKLEVGSIWHPASISLIHYAS